MKKFSRRAEKTKVPAGLGTIGLDLVLVERSQLERIQAELTDLRFAAECVIEAGRMAQKGRKQTEMGEWPPVID